jgi:hypothetical protein
MYRAFVIVVGAAATAIGLAGPAGADPGRNPCDAIALPVCAMVPIMPNLDHDIDLTTDDPQAGIGDGSR